MVSNLPVERPDLRLNRRFQTPPLGVVQHPLIQLFTPAYLVPIRTDSASVLSHGLLVTLSVLGHRLRHCIEDPILISEHLVLFFFEKGKASQTRTR